MFSAKDHIRFWSRVEVNGPDDCWTWTRGSSAPGSYGVIFAAGRRWLTHRLALALCGECVDGVLVLHSCDNPPCVNPRHLRVGTHLDNSRDAVERNRGVGRPPRYRHPKHARAARVLPPAESTLKAALRARVFEARRHTGLRVCDFARMMGIVPRSVMRWEDGTRIPSIEDLCRIATYSGVSLTWLLFDVCEKRAQIAKEAAG